MDKQKPKKSTFVFQAMVLASAGIIVRFIGFLYRWPLTSLIGDEGNDIFSSGYLLYTFFLILSSAGLPAAISKMVSERISKGNFNSAHLVFKVSLVFSAVFGLITAGFLAVFARAFSVFVESPDSYLSVLVLAPTIFIVSIMSVFRGYFQGMKNTVPTAVSQIIEQIFNGVFSVLLAYLLVDRGIAYGAAGGNAGTGIGALAGLISLLIIYSLYAPRLKRYLRSDNMAYAASNLQSSPTSASAAYRVLRGSLAKPQQMLKLGEVRAILTELIKTATPIIIGTAIFSMTNLIDLKMVKSLLISSGHFSLSEISKMYGQLTGKYVVITTMPVALATAMATAIVPNIAAYAAVGNRKQVYEKTKQALKLTMVIAIPAAVGIGMLGDQILLMLFPKYPAGGILLKVGSISIIFLSLSQIVTGILQGIGKLKAPAFAAFIGSIIKIPLNIILISNPRINIVGAVISTIACYMTASAIDITIMARSTRYRLNINDVFLKPLFASGVMALGCYVSYNVIITFVAGNTVACLCSILFGVMLYLLIMLLIDGFSRDDFDSIPMGSKIASRIYGTASRGKA